MSHAVSVNATSVIIRLIKNTEVNIDKEIFLCANVVVFPVRDINRLMKSGNKRTSPYVTIMGKSAVA